MVKVIIVIGILLHFCAPQLFSPTCPSAPGLTAPSLAGTNPTHKGRHHFYVRLYIEILIVVYNLHYAFHAWGE